MTSLDLFKEIQDLLYQMEVGCFTHVFQKLVILYINRLCYSDLLNYLNPDNENRPMTEAWEDLLLDKNQAIRSRSFCFRKFT